jgi:hypothetical protein
MYVPVDNMARDVMILMRAASITRALEGVGPENRDISCWISKGVGHVIEDVTEGSSKSL